jgi:pimeloyl-ACP methyl ester carboxylesterase
MKKYINLSIGKLAYQVYGAGRNDMIIFHGLMGSSWLPSDWIREIENSNLRCIVLERPGYGGSSPIKMECVADWFTIFQPIADTLAINHAIAVGISAGAVYAYASAFAASEAIDEIWILDGVPAVYMERVIRHYSKEAQETYHYFRNSTQPEIQDYYWPGLNDHIENLPSETVPTHRNSFMDAAANRCFGPAQESRLQIRPWGFEPSEIKQKVILWHAEADGMVPYNTAKEMKDILPFARLQTADPSLFKSDDTGLDIHMKSHPQGFLKMLADWRSKKSKNSI